jgi:alpha-beta hydrolase superfamily lysophospholipase
VVGWTLGDGPAVLLMHGWGGRAAQLLPLAEALAARGLRAVALDAPGHGASGPSRLGRGQSTFFDFADALLEASALLGPAVALAAHSGGAVAAHLALRGGLAPERVVLLAPMAGPARYADRYREALGLPPGVDAAWRARAAARLGFAWDDLDLVRSAGASPPATLVIHDRQDREVDFADGEAVAERWPGARLVATSGLGHRRLLQEPRVLRLAAEFLAGARGPGPGQQPASPPTAPRPGGSRPSRSS